MTLRPGDTLGAYRLVEEIGRGGMGVVWKALDTRLERHVALKVLPRGMAEVPDRLKRFEHEARTVASLNHPNIVTLFSVEHERDLHFITMELVEGRRLSALIPSGGLSLDRFFELAIPLADALSAAHLRGVIHRDLKPANVMVSRDGLLKVLDFGLAKLRPEAEDPDTAEMPTAPQSLLTSEGVVVGTVPYMAPEQLQGREVDRRADLFSLGVLYYEMATGTRPFRGDSSADLISSILRDVPPTVTELREEYPNHVGRIIRHCLEKNPDLRFQSAKDVRNELVALREEITLGRLKEPAVSAAPKWTWKPALPAAALGLVAVLALVAWAVLRPGAAAAPASAVAVLPFENLTGDPRHDHLSAGISAGLITKLSEVSGIQVLGRSSARGAREPGVSPAELGRRLGVGALLEGELQAEESGVRVDVKLTDAGSGLVLWSEDFRGSADESFALQREIARKLATVLAVPLTEKERRRMARDPTGSFQAWELFIRGRQELAGGGGPDAVEAASELFRHAVRVDPRFALAHAGLSEALWRSYHRDRSSVRLAEAEAEARRALAIDPELPAAQVALARVLRSTSRYDASIEELRKALDHHPKPDEAYRELAESHRRIGELEEAEKCLRTAAALGSRDWFNWTVLGAFLYEVGRYDEARGAFEKASDVAPEGVTVPHWNLAALTVQQGRFDEAIAAYERIPRPIGDAVLATNIGTAYYFSDRPDRWERAEEYYRLAVRLDPRRAVLRRNLADVYVDLGRGDDALHNYREALRLVEEQLRDDPRSHELRLEAALYSAKAEQCDRALARADEVAPELPAAANNHHALAHVYALCGRAEEALRAVESALELGFPPEILRQESEFASLREDPAFAALVSPGDDDRTGPAR